MKATPLPVGKMLHRYPLAFAAKYFYFRTFRGICEAHKAGRGNGIYDVNCGSRKIVKDCQGKRETAMQFSDLSFRFSD